MNKPAAIVFDLDGTLVDSLPDMLRAMNAFLARLGRPDVTLEDVKGWVGDGAKELVRRGLEASGGIPDQPLADLVRQYIDCYRGNAAHDTKPYPGVMETLHRLKQAGHRLAVCTNKPQALSDEVIEGLGMTGLFEAVIGGDAVPAKKPDAGHLRAALEAMGAYRAGEELRAVMVGDSINDVLAARGVGIPVVAVSFGYGRIEPRNLGADVLIDNFADLPKAAAPWL